MGSGVKLQGRGLLIYVDSFSIPEVVRLINVLIIRYRVVCNMQLYKDKRRIYIYHSSIDTLRTHVNSYLEVPQLKNLFYD